jgi:hypothetical protein
VAAEAGWECPAEEAEEAAASVNLRLPEDTEVAAAITDLIENRTALNANDIVYFV